MRSGLQIHDEDFPRLASGQLPENSNALPRLLGVTNLYFLKALPNWPNVLSTGKRTVLQRSVSDGGLQARHLLHVSLWSFAALPLSLQGGANTTPAEGTNRGMDCTHVSTEGHGCCCRASFRAKRGRGWGAR